jgi:inner membrane protein
MPTIMTHAIVPLAAALALGPARIIRPVAIAGAILAMLPDADVVGFKLGIAYADTWGHRGATHSLMLAAIVAAIATALIRPAQRAWTFAFLFAAMASHGLLDTLTNGGLGAALFWPFSDARIFAPFQPVQVSPIGAGFFSARGLAVIISELRWIILPAMILGVFGWALRRMAQAQR